LTLATEKEGEIETRCHLNINSGEIIMGAE